MEVVVGFWNALAVAGVDSGVLDSNPFSGLGDDEDLEWTLEPSLLPMTPSVVLDENPITWKEPVQGSLSPFEP